MEKKWWIWKNWWELPTDWDWWEYKFDRYNSEEWWFYLDYKNQFWYCSIDYDGKSEQKINFKDAIKELTGKKIKVTAKISEDGEVTITSNKTLSYETQYLRSDWILFTKDTIDWKNIEDLKQEMNNHVAEANKIRGLLKAHKNKF